MSARRVASLAVAVAVAAVVPAAPAASQPSRLRITAPADQSLLVHGEYPTVQSSCVSAEQPVLHARYRGTIEVARRDDGSLSLIGELPFEDYVRGIAEVPRDWPMEALKAQVIAARTYALNRLQNADTGGDYDLCATTACQVYVGMKVEAGPWGQRWIRAVDETAGQVLLHGNGPAITYYSSTSPGRTYDVEDVFGGEALPYLRGSEERDDEASPLSRWRTEVPFPDLARFLAAEGLWPGGPIRSVRVADGDIRVIGRQGVTLSKDGLRDALNDWAGCLLPDRYPPVEPGGYQLPQTVPSTWYRVEPEGDAVALIGRGWGHGVGMVQWGAYGKAKRGLGYADILAAYYGGLRPQPVELPGTIRILIAEGLRRITVAPSAGARTNPSVSPAAPWTITGGSRLRVRHGAQPQSLLDVTGVRLAGSVGPGEPVRGRLVAGDDVDLRLMLAGPKDVTLGPRPHEEGRIRFRFALPDLPPGRYRVRVEASDGVDTVASEPRTISVSAAPTEAASPSAMPPDGAVATAPRDDSDERSPVVAVTAGAVLLVAMILLVLTAWRRRRLHRA
jgi:SpoIID/LytB domain protein